MQSQEPSFIVKLLSKYDYPTKFIFISLLFAFSILVSNYFLFRSQYEKIEFARTELNGTKYQANLRRMLESVIKYQLLILQANREDPTSRSDLSLLQEQISMDFTNIKMLDSQMQNKFNTSAANFQEWNKSHLRPGEIEAKWNEILKNMNNGKSSEQTASRESILKDILSLFQYINDFSNLYFDPFMSSTYLADLNFIIIPNAQALIAQVTIQLASLSLENSFVLASDTRYKIAAKLALLEHYRELMREGVEKVILASKKLDHNVDVEYKIIEPLNQYLIELDAFLNFIKKNYLLTEKITERQYDVQTLSSKAIGAGFALWDISDEILVQILENRIMEYWKELLSVLLLSILCAVIGFSFGFIVMKAISVPLLRLLTAAKQLAGGDLSIRIPIAVEDEVGQVGMAFNQMVEALHELIGKLQWTGIQLTTSSTEISAAAKEQEATVVEQEATTKQIAVTAKEISATAKDFAKTMNTVSATAEQTSALASMVKSGLVKMEGAMRQMVEASTSIASKLAILNEKAGNITTVITTITKVADQTNLLSLNAAIEAEKAGEHGRSFAVIAREIRRLADQTANATFDIEKMVNEIVSAVSAGVMGVDKFNEEIHSGVNQVSVISDQLGKIIEQVQEVTESFESVNQGMQGQWVGAEQIYEAIMQLTSAAQQTTTSIRQFHNGIDQLNNAAQEMQTAVSKIKR